MTDAKHPATVNVTSKDFASTADICYIAGIKISAAQGVMN
jgi:hypothetical protein